MRLPAILPAVLAAAACTLLAQDPRAIVERSVARDDRDDALARNYTYLETVTEQEWKDGRRSKAETETFEILNLYGQPYRRLVARDGKPLPPADREKEQRKLDRLAAERARESPEKRQRRLDRYAAEQKERRAFLQEIPAAYRFAMAGETVIDNRPAWIIDATPIEGYRPRDRRAKLLKSFKGRFFVDKQDAALLKLEAEAIEPVSFGLVLARLDRGARFTLSKTHVNNELWMPARIKVDFDARLALLKRLKVDLQIDYSEFRKFQSESRIVAGISPPR
jgi:hypothetical protein